MCMCVSAMTILVLVAFSIVNLVLPFCKHSQSSAALTIKGLMTSKQPGKASACL